MITIKALMSAADFIKFNDDELIEISTSFGLQDKTIEQTILFVASKTNTTSICVTLGSQGAILYFGQKFYHNTGYPVDVVDTVGAGDSFLATLIDALLKNSDPQMALDRACAVGALVAQNQGANPKIYNTDIDNMLLK
jgi:fructokinase